ncbi:transcriptional regulator [Sphingobium sp. H39-3-25]|uniref:winged helix-turn-helix domain-containing protein n=1 Tax=Sphingobium arseniciresistens TaxID=3030834 RepID=UPI0023B8E0DE|nr:transcriptional regulator [Sphingobium arseniciresistens]
MTSIELSRHALASPAPHGGGEVAMPRSFAFGPFLLQPERQFLACDGEQLRIGGRAFDILTILVARPGQVVSKCELIERVWPALFVDPCNLKTNIAALRRTLGESHADARYIATVTGRGYRFICPVQVFGDGFRR